MVIHPMVRSFKFSSSAFNKFFLFELFRFSYDGSGFAVVVFGSDMVNLVESYVVDCVVCQFQR